MKVNQFCTDSIVACLLNAEYAKETVAITQSMKHRSGCDFTVSTNILRDGTGLIYYCSVLFFLLFLITQYTRAICLKYVLKILAVSCPGKTYLLLIGRRRSTAALLRLLII